MAILERLNLPRRRVLIYLWNPLVILEFAHGAHIDAWMIFLMTAGLWLILPTPQRDGYGLRARLGSPLAFAAATLTKGLPALLTPLMLRRWRWRGVAVYVFATLLGLTVFAIGASWGLTGPETGTGVFGAIRIFLRWWNYNSGIYHWLEVLITGYHTPGAVPIDAVGEGPIRFAQGMTASLLGLLVLATGWRAWRNDRPQRGTTIDHDLGIIRLSMIPLGAYLLLARTVHPWYVTLLLPILPFLSPRRGKASLWGRALWPWLYFSVAVTLSYLTYINPEMPQEFALIRKIEYLPTYALLLWAGGPWFLKQARKGIGALLSKTDVSGSSSAP
jgi:hypothetical protein